MTKDLQDLAWSCLPKEFKEEVKKLYIETEIELSKKKGSTDNLTQLLRGMNRQLAYLFGIHNLTSDAEGEEMLTVSRKKVQESYAKCKEATKNPYSYPDYSHESALSRMALLDILFGSKCLPDEEVKPAEPELRSDGTAHFDNIINYGFHDHNRLHIAAMAMQGILANPDITSGGDFENGTEYICNMALYYADTLIEAASKTK